jgi:acyl-homoserine lactone acylase PvdQ
MGRCSRLIAIGAGVVLAMPAVASARLDHGRQVFNVLPPGQGGSVPATRTSTDQIGLYDGLTPLWDRVDAAAVQRQFKSARFGSRGMRGTRERTPRRGLHIVRDRYGVPHVFGRTRDDVMFGAGWVTARDRSTVLEILRGPGRIAALDVPGVDAFQVATSLRRFTPTPAVERQISRQARAIRRRGPRGRRIARDVEQYVAGINAVYRRLRNGPRLWTENDVIATGALIGAVFGTGGGNEVRSADLLAQAQARFGADEGLRVWQDLAEQHDPEAPLTIERPFPYDQPPAGPTPGSPGVDAGSLNASAARAADVAHAARRPSSNALLVAASRSATGRPLAVMGPQVGYFYPEILMELDLHGGGIDVRGAAFPGVSFYVLLGRGRDFAWSATSAGSDIVDQFLEQLCEPGGRRATRASTHYLYKGRCRPMRRVDAGRLAAGGGQPAQRLVYRETVHGPVSGTVTVGGRPYAVASARSTRGRDTSGSVFAIEALNANRVRSARDFTRVMDRMELTFNWFYADDRDVAYFSSGRLPLRARGVRPGLPTLGTGRHEWRGFLPRSRHPQAINPGGGAVVNWNNKPAPGFGSADAQFGYGSVHRSELLEALPARARLEDVVATMNRAATQDLRAMRVWPSIARVLAGGPAPTETAQRAVELVSAWAGRGGSRLDGDGDGRVDDPGAAILDVAFADLGKAVLSPVLGPLADDGGPLQALEGIDQHPAQANGSSFFSGWYGYMDKDLRTLLGEPVNGPFHRRYCGGGDLTTCRAALWGAIVAATDRLAAQQGPDPAAWRADANPERLAFQPGLLGPARTMRWANRPTFQQVVEFGSHRRR